MSDAVNFTSESARRIAAVVQAADNTAHNETAPLSPANFAVARLFPVLVQQDGGAQGALGVAATYTYTVKSLDGQTTLGTTIKLARPRPFGQVQSQTTNPAYGLAFAIGPASSGGPNQVVLWDAGEIPLTTKC